MERSTAKPAKPQPKLNKLNEETDRGRERGRGCRQIYDKTSDSDGGQSTERRKAIDRLRILEKELTGASSLAVPKTEMLPCAEKFGGNEISLGFRRRRIVFELRDCGVHVVPGLGIRSEEIHLRLKPTGVIEAAGSDADEL